MLLDNRPSLKRSAPCSLSDKQYESSNLEDQNKLVAIHQEIMETFEKQTQLVPNANALPSTRFNNKLPILNYVPKSTKNKDTYLMWTLAQALIDDKLRDWLIQLVEPGLEAALSRIKAQTTDPWAELFTFLCFGQFKRASQKAKSIDFFELAMLIELSTVKSMRSVIEKQLAGLKSTGRWAEMTRYQKKVWYLLAGRLGHVPEDYIVTEDQSWECTLSMYIWYSQAVDEPISLSPFNDMFKRQNKKRLFQQSLAVQMIAQPDEECPWYQLLSWWYNENDNEDDEDDNDYVQGWPLELTWLLSFYRPDKFKDDRWALAWIERLQKLALPEWAIYASLFLKKEDVDKQVDHLLQVCEWEKEDVLLTSFHIPKQRILYAKALHAHDEWDFEAEYTIFLQASQLLEAKAALFDFLLPKLYKVDDASSLTSSLDYINKYSNQEDEEIKLFKDVYSTLLSKESSKVDTIISAFENVDMSPKRSYNFVKLVSKLNDALTDLTLL